MGCLFVKNHIENQLLTKLNVKNENNLNKNITIKEIKDQYLVNHE